MNILNVENVTKSLGTRTLFDGVSLGMNAGDKIGFIGINGTGKSTFLKIVAGLESPDEGKVVKGNDISVAYLSQNPSYDPEESVLDYVVKGKCTEESRPTVESEGKRLLNTLGIVDFEEKMGYLSGGQRKRVALSRTLLVPARVLILDEPTNHLDSDMVNWLEEYLVKFKGELLMVTHDRYFLDSVTNKIVELDNSKLYEYDANYQGFLELKNQRAQMEAATYRKNQSILRKELAWVMRGCQARSTKQQARLDRFEELKNAKAPVLESSVQIESVSSRMGKKTIEIENVSKSFGDKVIFRDFSYIVLRNERIGIVGPNGCGKSTLIKVITGVLQPDTGSVVCGETIKIGYFMQENEPMDDNRRVIDYIRDIGEFLQTRDGKISASKMLERFLFTPDMQYTLIGKLSGGEKRRLYLLSVLMSAPNVLILDEPTNDLDITTLTILEDYLDGFEGIVITVSHDRYFLDRTVNRIFAFEDCKIVQYEGGYTDYQHKRRVDFGKNEAVSSIYNKEKTVKPKSEKVKFTYMEKKEFETIDDDIAKLEGDLQQCEVDIAANATNYPKLKELMEKKGLLSGQLEEKMDRWVYLNDLNERINGEK